MVNRKDLKKINDYIWEIPKSYRNDMRVPARIYSDKTLLDSILKDKSLSQLVNVATLPGIVKYAIGMPDCHQGYASPIGGVAAIQVSDGVISPGMCVSGDARVLHSLGYYLPIKKFADKSSHKVSCINLERKRMDAGYISKFFQLKINPSIFKVITKAGKEIKTTGDHPFFTEAGMVAIKDIKMGEKIALFPFEGVPHEDPKEKILVDEKKIKKCWQMLNQNPAGHGLRQTINRLKARDLLPLKTTSPKFPYLLKIMGYLLGDGTMFFWRKKSRGQVSFYGRNEDLELLQKDMKIIGFYGNIQKRFRQYQIKTTYNTYQFQREEVSLNVRYSSLVLLLQTLGMPLGSKTEQDFILPKWLLGLPLWQKRLFLAGFFGAELTSPATIKNRGFNFYAPILGINKRKKYIKSGYELLSQLSQVLGEFGIKTRKIIKRKEQTNRKGGTSWRLRLILSSSPQNLYNLWSKIGFEYQSEKQFLGNIALHYIKSKQRFIEDKIFKRGIHSRQGVKKFHKSQISLLRKLISQGGKNLARPFVGQFLIFKEFIEIAAKNLGKSGLVWDTVELIEKIPFKDYVYDFTINHPDHNFIANGFLVSNCGYDIDCGIRLLKSELKEGEIQPHLGKLATEIQKEVPSGLGKGGKIKLDSARMNKILEKGAEALIEDGYGEKDDLEHCEAYGRLLYANASFVSSRAKSRGRDQVGTLGSGNHFLEIQKVDEIFDTETANVFKLFKDQVVIMIHCGSRGLGHQVCTDYLREFMPLMETKYNITVPDREFACVPFNSSEGQRYFAAMAAAANYAWANRQMITHFVRKAWKNILGEKAFSLTLLYDVAHNIIKKETYTIGGKQIDCIVHRKGATRAFPPKSAELPKVYRHVGQPVLIPGTMGTASYVLVGTEKGEESFYSVNHGAGRRMSRNAAKRMVSGEDVVKQLKKKGILIKCWSMRGIAEEAPLAYKDVDHVVDVVHNAGLAKKVARLIPLAVIKGE